MTEDNGSTEGEEKFRSLSERVGVHVDRGRLSGWKRAIPYPSSIDVRSRELEVTVNSEWLRPKLHALRHYSREIRGLVGVTAAVSLLLSVFVGYIPLELRILLAGVSILLAVLASLQFRVVAKGDDTEMRETLRRIGRAAAFLLLGVIGTGGVALVLLNVTQPVQEVIYHTVYLQVGPSEATKTAILTHFIAMGVAAISVPMLVGDYLSDRLAHRVAFAKGIGVMLLLLLVFVVVTLAGLAAFLTAIIVLAAAFVAVPLLLRYRFGVRSGGIHAFVGGIPVLVLLLLAAGFGLGWGWGYVMTAQEVPASSVNDTTAADFDDVPAVRDDLFVSGDCETDTEGRRVCRLYLRGYQHERAAARFMARHGVRCPYQNAQTAGGSNTFVGRHDGQYYRVTCSPHGD